MGRHNQAKGQENGRSLRQTPRETEEEEGGMHRSDPKGRTHLCLGKRAEKIVGDIYPSRPRSPHGVPVWVLGAGVRQDQGVNPAPPLCNYVT